MIGFARAPWFAVLAAAPLLVCATPAMSAAAAATPPQKVLFIGNSNTYLNNLPALFTAVARRARPDAPPPATDMLVAPGAELKDFVFDDYFTSYLARERFDLVVLQERGGLLGCMSSGVRPRPTECSTSVNAHRRLAKMARESGARVILFGTWSMTPGMQSAVSSGTRQVGRAVKAPVVDVGTALERAARTDSTLSLTWPDTHPRPLGSLLIAVALWETASGVRLPDGAFSAEIPVWPPRTQYNLLRPVSRQKNLPATQPLRVEATPDEMSTILAAVRGTQKGARVN